MAADQSDSSADAPDEAFETVDWEREGALGLIDLIRPPLVLLVFLAMIVPVVYDRLGPDHGAIAIGPWTFMHNEWMYAVALILIGIYLLPAVRSLGWVREVWRRYRQSWLAVVFGAIAFALFLIATIGPIVIGIPEFRVQYRYQPPIGYEIEIWKINSCYGEVVGQMCQATWANPIGTEGTGRNLLVYTIFGLQTSFYVGFTATVIAVTIGTMFGTVAAYYGGRLEGVIMRVVDLMHAVPAFFVYALLAAITMEAEGDMVMMTLVFGLLSWGGIARLVRSEVLQMKEQLFVLTAESTGARSGYVLRRHILPNTMSTVLTAATLLVPTFMLFEAALSYLGLGDPNPIVISLGDEIRRGLGSSMPEFLDIWWAWGVPAVVLVIMLLAVTIAGDALRDATDPRLD